MDLPGVAESSRLDKGKSPQVVETTGDMPGPHNIVYKDADDIVQFIQDLFTSWEQTTTSRPGSTNHSSAPSSVLSDDHIKSFKQSLLEYVSFMDVEIGHASAGRQRDKLETLGVQLLQTLSLPSLNVSANFKAKLKVFHADILSLLARNVELKAKSAQYLHAVSERESLLQEINKTNAELIDIFSEVMVEDSLLLNLAAEMKEIQAKMDNCRAIIAAKNRNTSQGIDRNKSLIEHYNKLEVDDDLVNELNVISSQQKDEWGRLREKMRSAWGEL